MSATIDYTQVYNCTVDSESATEWDGTTSIKITLTCNDGYYFPVSPALYYTYVSDDVEENTSITRQSSTSYTTATKTVKSVGEEIYNPYVIAKALPQTITPSKNLVNCTTTFPDSVTVEFDPDPATYTITANDNCTFSTAPTVLVSFADSADNVTYTATLSSDNKTATITDFALDINSGASTLNIKNLNIVESITITAEAITEAATSIPITTTLENCTLLSEPTFTDSVEIGTLYTIQLSANDNCFFKGSTTSSCIVTYADGTRSGISITTIKAYDNDYENNLWEVVQYIFTLSNNSSGSSPVSVAITGEAINITTQEFSVTTNFTYCTGENIPSSVVYNTDYTLTITTNTGYYFAEAPTATYQYVGGATKETLTFTLDSDKHTATATLNLAWRVTTDGITITGLATAETTYTDKYGSINIYNPTIDELNQFAQQRFTKTTVTATTSQAETYATVEDVDMGNYIAELHRIYANIGDIFENTMIIGKWNTGITTHTPYDDEIVIDNGEVTITGHNSTATDYLSTIKILLPFIGFVQVDVDTTINHTLHLYYKGTLLNGNAIAVLEVDGIAMYTWECSISQPIIYRVNQNYDTVSKAEFDSKFLYGFTPYILLTYYTDTNNRQVHSNSVRATVKNMNGRFTMEELDNFNTSTLCEIECAEIERLLKEGVIYEQQS